MTLVGAFVSCNGLLGSRAAPTTTRIVGLGKLGKHVSRLWSEIRHHNWFGLRSRRSEHHDTRCAYRHTAEIL
jgi:hypothetical protein